MWTVAFAAKDGTLRPVLDIKLTKKNATELRQQWEEETGRAVIALPHSKAAAIFRAQHAAKAEHPWVVYVVDLRTRQIKQLPEMVSARWFKTWQRTFSRNSGLPKSVRLVFLPSY